MDGEVTLTSCSKGLGAAGLLTPVMAAQLGENQLAFLGSTKPISSA